MEPTESTTITPSQFSFVLPGQQQTPAADGEAAPAASPFNFNFSFGCAPALSCMRFPNLRRAGVLCSSGATTEGDGNEDEGDGEGEEGEMDEGDEGDEGGV